MFGLKKCSENHWKVIDGQLVLDTPTQDQQEVSMRMVAVIEAKTRLKIYEEICDLKLTENRKQIIKSTGGNLDNLVLAVQALCADVALGERNG